VVVDAQDRHGERDRLPTLQLLGCDFSSSPSKKKQIVLAFGRLSGNVLKLENTERFSTLVGWANRLHHGSWLGAFDLPFGLPRELVQTLGWPTEWQACLQHFTTLSRADIRLRFQAFCNARPPGHKFAHRATDLPAGSSPSMKWVNPPVAWMLHAGVPPLVASGAWLGGVMPVPEVPPSRVALEAYPGLLAREVLGTRSYKSDDKARQTPERWLARKDLVTALEQGRTRLGLRLKLSPAQADALVSDTSGDSLDAVLCLMQAAWAQQRHMEGDGRFGLPAHADPLEGWIVTA